MLYEQGVAGTSYTDTNVTNGVTYYYQVSAGNGVGESNLSQEVSATPLPAAARCPGVADGNRAEQFANQPDLDGAGGHRHQLHAGAIHRRGESSRR